MFQVDQLQDNKTGVVHMYSVGKGGAGALGVGWQPMGITGH